MNFRTLSLTVALAAGPATAVAQDDAELVAELSRTYSAWRQAIIDKNAARWRNLTAEHRQMEVRNRLVSEKRPFPAAVFDLPAPPPSLDGLECLYVSRNGPTAKASYFGNVNFGGGPAPNSNLLVLSFVRGGRGWLYDKADYVNLGALPEVRKELAAGDTGYLSQVEESQASGEIPDTPGAVPRADYIAKVYVFCPGRDVEVQINRISRHQFIDTKEAEVILGGARLGRNEITYRTKLLDGATGEEAFAIRVYLMSEIEGTKPVIVWERVSEEGEPVENLESGSFKLDRGTADRLVP